jgi:hypothetical protein
MNCVRGILPSCLLLLASGPAFAQSTPSTPATTVAETAPPTQPSPAPAVRANADYDLVIYPILGWLPVVGIDFTFPDNPSSDVSSGLSGAAFVVFRWEFGRFAVFTDYSFAGVTADRTSPTAVVKLDVTTVPIFGGVKIVNGLYIDAGARYREIDLRGSINDRPGVSWNPSRWDPAIGATFRPQLGSNWRLYSHIDWAGMGGDHLSTVNGDARIEWVPLRHLALTGGYAFGTMKASGEIRSEPIHVDYTFHGPLLGFGIPF